eukprot:766553-Hanusia_phi.AAC.1
MTISWFLARFLRRADENEYQAQFHQQLYPTLPDMPTETSLMLRGDMDLLVLLSPRDLAVEVKTIDAQTLRRAVPQREGGREGGRVRETECV